MAPLQRRLEGGENQNSPNMRLISNINLKGEHLLQASQCADQAQRERINMCGKSEMRNRLRYESQVKTSQELEELRIICFEEANRVRRLQIKELSVRQERDPNL